MADLPDLKDATYDPVNVGLRIKAIRRYLSVTQEGFATVVGVSQTTVADWERGETRPSFAVANYLKANYGITYDWLYQGDHAWLPHALAIALVNAFIDERAKLKRKRDKSNNKKKS